LVDIHKFPTVDVESIAQFGNVSGTSVAYRPLQRVRIIPVFLLIALAGVVAAPRIGWLTIRLGRAPF
jgi:hypothetical protein